MQDIGSNDKEIDSDNITLDPSVLKEKKEKYSSLTDTNGVNLFTDEYENKVKDVQMQERGLSYNVQNRIFCFYGEEGEFYDQQVQAQLFLTMDTPVKKEYRKSENNKIGSTVALVGTILIVFFFILLFLSEKREKRRRADAINNYTYE